MDRKYYSLHEARELLPKIKPLIKKLITYHLTLVIQNNLSIEYDDPYDDMKQSVIESKQWHKAQHNYFKLLRWEFLLRILLLDWWICLVFMKVKKYFYAINIQKKQFLIGMS